MTYAYRAKLIRCVDGDTADLAVDLGFYLTARIRCRLTGIDTPERGREGFPEATKMLESLISEQSDEQGYFEITTGKTGKYGRWLVTIDGVNTVLAKKWPYA